MPVQQFVLILDQPPTAEQATALTHQHPDMDVGDTDGWITVQRPAPSLADAVVCAVRDLEAVRLRPVRVADGDWVTLGHIAKRISRSRELVRLWSIRRQGPGGCPPPLNPGRQTSFYSWAEVAQWLRTRMGYHRCAAAEPPAATRAAPAGCAGHQIYPVGAVSRLRKPAHRHGRAWTLRPPGRGGMATG